jgi:hypothetical protein
MRCLWPADVLHALRTRSPSAMAWPGHYFADGHDATANHQVTSSGDQTRHYQTAMQVSYIANAKRSPSKLQPCCVGALMCTQHMLTGTLLSRAHSHSQTDFVMRPSTLWYNAATQQPLHKQSIVYKRNNRPCMHACTHLAHQNIQGQQCIRQPTII